LEKEIEKYSVHNIPKILLEEAKHKGFADRQIAHTLRCLESEVYDKRNSLGIKRIYKCVDTCAAEFEAKTPYYYSTFGQEGAEVLDNESVVSTKKKVVVLGSGPNRIGQGIEFDYSCVHGVLAAKEAGYETIMINSNPETVSTDFDIADKLYFEPVFWEHIYDIIMHENPVGVIVQLGGQTALKLAEKMVTYYGMGSNIIYPSSSEKYKELIDNDVIRLINEAYNYAEIVLFECRDLIEETAEILKIDKILKADRILDLIKEKYNHIWEIKKGLE
jgi:hypothetical protein